MEPNHDSSSFDVKDHAYEILSQLDSMRKANEHCDLTIKVGCKEIRVHRVVMSAASVYFHSILAHDNIETRTGVIEMKNADLESVTKCVDFIYSGQVLITDENYDQLMKVAHMLQLEKLCNKIATFLEGKTTLEEFLTINTFARIFDCKRLILKCNEFTSKNFRTFIFTNDFQYFDKSLISFVIASRETKATEDYKTKALIEWTKFDLESREPNFEDVFLTLDFSKFSRSYRKFLIENEPLVLKSNRCVSALVKHSNDLAKVRAKDVNLKDVFENNVIGVFNKITGKIEAFEPEHKTWTNIADTSNQFIHYCFTVVRLGKVLYVLAFGRKSYKLNYTGDCAIWEELPYRYVTCKRLEAVGFKDSVYVFDDMDKHSKAVEKYDSYLEDWEQETDKPINGWLVSLVSTNDYIYCIGGYNENGDLSSVTQYNGLDWTTLPDMPTARHGAASVECNGRIYVMGGVSGDDCLATTEYFDISNGTWTTLKPMLKPRTVFKAFVLGGDIFVAQYNVSIMEFEKFDLVENIWQIIETFTGTDVQYRSFFALTLPIQ
uniref:kelch-like protein 12 n=1 Tax=Styela clava TaxID=7725 RepID=UPI0019399952|nr:kelch-like protein 12 [Styela clava]